MLRILGEGGRNSVERLKLYFMCVRNSEALIIDRKAAL
jgi:hypothetical protein